MSVDVDEARKDFSTWSGIPDKILFNEATLGEVMASCRRMKEIHIPALLAEVVALQKEELLYQCKLKALGQRVVQERDKRESLRTRLDKAVAALNDVGAAIENPLMLDKRIAQVEAILALWREEVDDAETDV